MSSQYFAHANVLLYEGKPVPIQFSTIATIPSDDSDPKVMCIRVNDAGLTSTPKELRSNIHENRLVHHPLPKSVPLEYLHFCVRGELSQLGQGSLTV
ncbi:hypothetical protein TNCV_1337271 [Trichonephila clavipes]|nr:hypothetical protein TNCV_1337271 [Trichonephila clavipes]